MPRLSPPLDKMSRSRDSRGTAKPLPGRSEPHDGGELFQQIGQQSLKVCVVSVIGRMFAANLNAGCLDGKMDEHLCSFVYDQFS